MTVGTSSWDGLGMGLNGEYNITQQSISYDILTLTSAASNASDFFVCRDSDGSELIRIEDDSAIWQSITTDAGTGCNIRSYRTLGVSSTGQSYAAQFLLDEATFTAGTGRNAVLYLRYDYSGGSSAPQARSFINFDDHATDCPTLFTFSSHAGAAGCFETITSSTATHGLVIYDGAGTKYWIMCCDSSKE